MIATCTALVVLTGIAGIAVDVGRLYIAKSEVQSFTDSAAVAAALQLDGSSLGILRARAAITNTASGVNAMKWDMATKAVSNYSVTFARGLSNALNTIDSTTWSANPPDPANYRFAKVTAGVAVPLTFMRVFRGLTNGESASLQNVNVTGTAGQMLLTNAGTEYTLRYPPAAKANNVDFCPGDRGETQPISRNEPIPSVEREDTTDAAALDRRVAEDSDPGFPTYSQHIEKRNGSLCAEYIGPSVQGSPNAGGGAVTPRGFLVRLVQ